MKKMILLLVFIILVLHWNTSWSESPGKKVIYKYKQYEKFDFEDLMIEGDQGNPGDISVNPRFKKAFQNRLPEKRNFNREIRSAVESIN